MLGKLVKYEFKSTTRIMWFLYGGLLIVAMLLGITLRVGLGWGSQDGSSLYNWSVGTDDNIFLAILITALGLIYLLLMWAISIITTVMIVLRFYRNLLGGEGYLMHTLPVKTSSLIWSKFIVAMIWMLIAGIAAILSAILLGLTSGILPMLIKEITWEQFKLLLNTVFSFNGFLVFMVGVSSVFYSIFTFYFSMAIGNLADKNKILFSVLTYLGISIGMTVIMSIIGVVGGDFWDLIMEDITFASLLIPTILINAVLGIGFYFGTNFILKNKLNLA